MEPHLMGNDAYRQHFVPKDYLKMYYSFSGGKQEERNVLEFILRSLHKIFTLDGVRGETLIDIGSGPSIYQFLSSCECFREIIATDFTAQNREEMQRWLKKESEAFDWSPVVQYVAELEGDREKWVEKEEKVRRTIRRVLKCDVTLPNPVSPLVLPPVCCVTSQFCLESVCRDLSSYRSAVKNLSALLKPGGHLVLVMALKSSLYMVGQQRFFCLGLDYETVNGAVREEGFEIRWSELGTVQHSRAITDNSDVYVLAAQKKYGAL